MYYEKLQILKKMQYDSIFIYSRIYLISHLNKI